MKIERIRWTSDRINHIARHGISPGEVEEAAFDNYNVIQTLKKAIRDPRQKVYRLLGRSNSGKFIVFIFIYEGRGTAYPVTAREMTPAERRYYLERKRFS